MNEPNKRLGKNVGAAHRHGLSLSVRVGLAGVGLLLGVKTVYDVNRGWSYGRYRISGFDRHDDPALFWLSIAGWAGTSLALIFLAGRGFRRKKQTRS